MIKQKNYYPFSAVVGQDDFKLALILNLIDPLIGGVLAVGDKGTGKTTLIRSLTGLMELNGDFPFVNLPIGTTEDRLLGSVDLEKLINDKLEVVKLGLLAQAHNGVLYVDEINLLEDYLTDVLLDATVSGGYHLEREGISRYLDSRFCLVGSMNPEEGDLRPQLKDRFGLSVEISTPKDVETRKSIIQNRMAFEDNKEAFLTRFKGQEKELARVINQAKSVLKKVGTEDAIISRCSELALEYEVEGLRADVLLLRTARAYTAYLGEASVTEEHLNKIAPFVLNHRSNKKSPPNQSPQENQENENQEGDSQEEQSGTAYLSPVTPENDFKKLPSDHGSNPTFSGNKQKTKRQEVDLKKSVGQYLATDKFQLKTKRAKQTAEEHHVFLIDSSGSMLANKMVAFAKGAVNKIANQNKGRKTTYSIISLFDGEALLSLTSSTILQEVEEALSEIKTGGKTNLIAGLKQVKQITTSPDSSHFLNIITDGRFNVGGDLDDTIVSFKTYCKGITRTRLIDAEQGNVKLGMTLEFANQIDGVYEQLEVING